MKRLGTILAAAALVAVGSPTQAKALDFGLFCGGNALTTCAAVDVYVEGGFLRVDVLNLSGFNGTPENTVFTKIGLNDLGITGASNLQVMFAGGGWENASDYGWGLDSGNFAAGFSAEIIAEGSTPNAAIASTCATSPPGGLDVKWFTPGCEDGSIDYTQAVSFRFEYDGDVSFADASVLIRGQNAGTGDDTGGSLVCDTATNCEPTEVPDPGTMILLGTGLAGVLGVRRRKNEEV